MDTKDIYERCNQLIEELSRFDASMTEIGPAIKDHRLREFEKQIGFELPLDLKYFLTVNNGVSLMGVEILGLDEVNQGQSLNEVYQFEHFEVDNKMPMHYLPISPDGMGNHYCLDLPKLENGLCPVVFWQHDYEYASLDEVETCNPNFMEWVQEVVIDWTLMDYNYDGSEK
ncbi:SMI1/KNR4 family protein [Mucilaginibacter conchicola]|uniref:SMI1/KNR4 family protein n=1 Tax=Mucilaginibacter conchicola TaxID=2303333 RepID=A0A372NPM3_9SPHI|nr:SMI1/KNR4 family protein [Mucilaginibacter conchicola]RFZ90881.1 SMI1/KNR4 family protein [Mucilaginibacter conchicola]